MSDKYTIVVEKKYRDKGPEHAGLLCRLETHFRRDKEQIIPRGNESCLLARFARYANNTIVMKKKRTTKQLFCEDKMENATSTKMQPSHGASPKHVVEKTSEAEHTVLLPGGSLNEVVDISRATNRQP